MFDCEFVCGFGVRLFGLLYAFGVGIRHYLMMFGFCCCIDLILFWCDLICVWLVWGVGLILIAIFGGLGLVLCFCVCVAFCFRYGR